MADKGREDEFMKQYMSTCKEQIEKLARDPQLLNDTLKPFMQMSQQLVDSGMLGSAMPGMISDSGSMDINKMIAQMKAMIDYIKSNHKELVKEYDSQDDVIKDLDELSKKLRSLIKKVIERIENK